MEKSHSAPYKIGALIGLLSALSFFLFNKTLGTSTAFVRIAALFWKIFNPDHLSESSYYQNYLKDGAWIDWQLSLIVGIFLGAMLIHKKEKAPVCEHPPITKKRYVSAFLGGAILLFGARLAGGCTSGHAISGGVQLALSAWIFMLGVFASGIPLAHFLYKKEHA